jgi:hypothetical protein
MPLIYRRKMSVVPGGARITVVGQMVHTDESGGLSVAEDRYSRPCKDGKEQTYQRKIFIGPSWEKLNTGWVKEIGELHLQNREAKNWQNNPTPQELEEALSRIVQLGINVDSRHIAIATIRPGGRRLALEPVSSEEFYVRCLNGTAECFLTVMPA